MVTAGVYLLLRSSPILEFGSTALILITWVGALTAFFAATTGLLQNDLKRVIAYSTCSQLGLLFLICGLSQYNVALFHLVNHAWFKALLFLSAGSVIHAMNDEQDLRKFGGLSRLLPFTYSMMVIGSLSLMALPFLTGFYSKDLIIELAYGHYSFSGNLVYWLASVAAVFTAMYSIRSLYLTFLGYPNGPKINYQNIHEAPLIMAIPLVILAVFSIFFGYVTKDLFVGMGTDFYNNALFIHPNHSILVDTEFGLPLSMKFLPLIGPACVAGVMGGVESEITEETRSVFLESAYFDPKTIRRQSKRLGLSSDSSYRFERGIDPFTQAEMWVTLTIILMQRVFLKH